MTEECEHPAVNLDGRCALCNEMSISLECPLCGNQVDPFNKTAWKEVRGWVGGPKKDHMRLREDTGRFAHGECVQKVLEGQSPDQPSMFEEPVGPPISSWAPSPDELFDDNRPE